MAKLKAGIIGLGVGESHIEGYNAHPGCEVTALCDFSEEKLALARTKFPGLKLTSNPSDILGDSSIDVISIASYDNHHYGQILQAIKNNKHLFVEKPICLFYDELENIRKLLVEHPGLKLSSNFVLRTCPRFIRIREAVRSGEMGSLFYIEGDYFWGRIYKLAQGDGFLLYYLWRCNSHD